MIIRRRYENYAQHSSWIRCIECLAAALQSSFDVLVSALDDHTNIPGSFNSIWPQECIMSLLPRHCMLTANACMAICPQGFVIKKCRNLAKFAGQNFERKNITAKSREFAHYNILGFTK